MNEARAPADTPATEGGPLLSAETLFGIASLELRARAIAEGVLAGTHASRRFGSSAEFAEHKVYTPGDDLRRLDWKAYARVDRYFVRRYEEVTNLDVALVVDTSGSMAYAGGARGAFSVSKLACAKTLAAAIAWLAVEHSDATSLSIFADGEQSFLPARSRRDHLSLVFQQLEGAAAAGKTGLLPTLEQVARRTSRRALVVVISDLLDTGPDAFGPLGVLRRRGCDVLVIHVLDRDELSFPFDGVVRFEDMEGPREVQVDAPLVRKAYLEELDRFIEGLRQDAGKRDLRYHLHASDTSPVASLRTALAATRLRGGR